MAAFPNQKGMEGKEDNFIFNGKYGYYGRYCENYLKKCETCKFYQNLRCREGQVKG